MTMSNDEIAALRDPVVRNLMITQRYHELAVQLRDAGVGEDATWCAFAVWASKTAGATIRGEVLPSNAGDLNLDNEDLRGTLDRFNRGIAAWAFKHLSHDHLDGAIRDVTADVSDAIAGGNVMVFSELAPLFTAMLAQPSSLNAATGPGAIDAIASSPGSDASSKTAPGVATAFSAYAAALASPPARPFLVLQANTLAVAHEQQRLEPAIRRALNAAVSDTLKKVIDQDVARHVPTHQARRAVERLTDDVCSLIDAAWDTCLTEAIMRLVTATETLDLRRDVPPLHGELFPSTLTDLSGTEAEAVVREWDKTGGTGKPSGARDWAELGERMNFIVNLFRSRQRDPSLFSPPFSSAQLAVLAEGRRPPGPL